MPCLAVIAALTLAPVKLVPYVNGRWDFLISRPSNWVASEPPTNGSGQEWKSPDGKASLSCWGSFNAVPWTFKEVCDQQMERVKEVKGKVTYRKIGKTFAVVSYSYSGREVYERVDFTTGVVSGWSFSAPISQHIEMSKLTERIAKTWKPATKERD
ncbi:MAG: hypothetical protein JST35_04630 [Armatimonadetes bacterium]|nr:hypothetical protein [Armatimonadota bacterium]